MGDKNRTRRLTADATGVAEAARLLTSGGLVALPTETVYGLAARADNPAAVKRIFAAKRRPRFNPLIVHVGSLDEAEALARFSGLSRELAETYWPGPLTLVLPRRPAVRLADAVTAALPTVALRMPDHPSMRAVLATCGLPLAAPSANRSGGVSPTSAEHVLESLGGAIDAVLDGGSTECGLESTIVAVRDDGTLHELRPGPLDLQELRGATSASFGQIEAPGQLGRHYAPGKPLRLGASRAYKDEFQIGFAAVAGDCTLSASGDLAEAARRLYLCLHEAAGSAKPRIAVAPVPDHGIGRAINDRLQRAAA